MKALMVVLISVFFFACSKDVVTDHDPVSADDWRTEIVTKLRSADNDVQRSAIMEQSGVRLTTQLIHFLKSSGYNCPIDTITYHYGSGKAMDVASGDGNTYDGKFKSQPYAVVKGGACFKGTLYVFILCFNGTFSLESDSKIIGHGSQVFTIRSGKGINYYVDYRTSIWLAEEFNLPLYKGSGWNKKNIITPEEALYLEDQLGMTKVTVRVFAGDTFDLRNMTLNGRPAN